MRIKRPYIVLSFHTTLEASRIPGRLIPLPREISAGCGLAWRMLPEEWELWQTKLKDCRFEAVTTVEQ